MSSFTLDPKPTFKMKVDIPVPGDSFVPVEFTFKYRNRTELKKLTDTIIPKIKKDIDFVKEVAVGWELKEEFNDENLERLNENYMGAVLAIYRAYIEGLTGVREKN